MTTVGYGDITPTNFGERIYTIVIMFVGATLFGYVIGSLRGEGRAVPSVVESRSCCGDSISIQPVTERKAA